MAMPADDAGCAEGRRVTLLLVGSTGLVGRHLLQLALDDPRVGHITALVRRPLPAHPKLQVEIVDFDALPQHADWWAADAVICTLGTTIRTAGSQQAFTRVDHDYPLQVARVAHARGTPCYVLNSAFSADPASRVFYSRVKGETERDLAAVGFRSLTFVRPGVIDGKRGEFRAGERALVLGLRMFGALLPRRWRLNPAQRIAAALLHAAVKQPPGIHRVESAELA